MKNCRPILALLLVLTGAFPAVAAAADTTCAPVVLSGSAPDGVALFLTSSDNPGARTSRRDTTQPGWCRATGMDLLEVSVPSGGSGTRSRSSYFDIRHVQQAQTVDIHIVPPADPTLSVGGKTYQPGE